MELPVLPSSNMRNAIFSILFLTTFNTALNGQGSIRDSAIAMHIIGIGYSAQMPGGDLADRFGWNSSVELSYAYKFRNSYFFSVNGGFLFGNNLKEDTILNIIRNADGLILGNDAKFAEIRLFERGFITSLTAGKLITWNKPNPNSGLMLSAGPVFLQHKIRIETIGNTVTQLDKEYKKGYDRLTNGMGLHESLTYVYFGNRYLVNFYFGVELMQALTKNRRSYNFDSMSRDDKNRLDLLFGIRAGWMLPVYRKAPQQFYYY